MNKPEFVYVTYIATTPEKAWQALIDVDAMSQWWVDPKAGCARVNVSDWKPGSRWEHKRVDGSDIVDIVGTVVENTPPSRLVFTWAIAPASPEPEFASRVTIEIVPRGAGCTLTLTHDIPAEWADYAERVTQGWTKILAAQNKVLTA